MKIPDGWDIVNDELVRELEFDTYDELIKFVNTCAQHAISVDHHPNMYLHDWKKLRIELRTHSEDAITDKDYSFAEKVNQLLV